MKNIFSVSYTDDSRTKTEICYNPGNAMTLAGALVACMLNQKEVREAVFNAVANAIAIADNPAEWREALDNGIRYAMGRAKIEADKDRTKMS